MFARGVPCPQGEKSAIVSVAFYTGEPSGEPLINQVTQFVTGSKYIHCEIVFHTEGGSNLSCGVWQGQHVFLRPKTFFKASWVWKSVRMKTELIARMKRWCRTQADARKPFNRWGILRCRSPFPRATDGTTWFCSELCTAAFQHVGYFTDEEPGSVCPSYFYELMNTLDSFQAMSPLVESRIERNKLTMPCQKAETAATPKPALQFKFKAYEKKNRYKS